MFSEVRSFKPLEMRVVFLFYFLLGLLAAIWDWSSRGHPFYVWMQSEPVSSNFIIVSAVLVALYVALVWSLTRFIEAIRAIDSMFVQLLTPISYFHIVSLALVSSVVEEWLFRGIFVDHFGLIVSSLAFGLCHFIPIARLWLWSLWSLAGGLLLGAVYEQTQSLWAPLWIHFLINLLGLWLINWRAYQSPRFGSAQ
jgi:uncharacterized protein